MNVMMCYPESIPEADALHKMHSDAKSVLGGYSVHIVRDSYSSGCGDLYDLGRIIANLGDVDLIFFHPDWSKSDRCKVIWLVACLYKIRRMVYDGYSGKIVIYHNDDYDDLEIRRVRIKEWEGTLYDLPEELPVQVLPVSCEL